MVRKVAAQDQHSRPPEVSPCIVRRYVMNLAAEKDDDEEGEGDRDAEKCDRRSHSGGSTVGKQRGVGVGDEGGIRKGQSGLLLFLNFLRLCFNFLEISTILGIS